MALQAPKAGPSQEQVSIEIPVIIVVDPLVTGALAVIVTGPPAATHVARPAVLIVATVVTDDVHVSPSVVVSMRVVLLLNVPVAVN